MLGDPVAHSLSPTMHAAAFEALGIEADYGRRRVDRAGMERAAAELRSGRLDGANVTMPHKRLAADLSDSLGDEAARAHSVNTWVPADGEITGHSTDVAGVRRVVDDLGLPDGPVVVLGTGGAAAASLIALAGRPITVIARRVEAGQSMAAQCGVDATVRPWEEPAPAGLVVNCTPIGMAGEELPVRHLWQATGFFEMVYASGETPAQRAMMARGVPVAGGLALLAAQAEASFELWTGHAPPSHVMYGSVDKHLKGNAGDVES